MKRVWRFSLLVLALTQMQRHASDALSQADRQSFPFTSARPNQAASGIERHVFCMDTLMLLFHYCLTIIIIIESNN